MAAEAICQARQLATRRRDTRSEGFRLSHKTRRLPA